MKAASIDLHVNVTLVVLTGHTVHLLDQFMQARAQLLHARHQASGVTLAQRCLCRQLAGGQTCSEGSNHRRLGTELAHQATPQQPTDQQGCQQRQATHQQDDVACILLGGGREQLALAPQFQVVFAQITDRRQRRVLQGLARLDQGTGRGLIAAGDERVETRLQAGELLQATTQLLQQCGVMVVGDQLGLIVIQGFGNDTETLGHALGVTRHDIFLGIVQMLPLQGMKVGEGRGGTVDVQQAGDRVGIGITGARIDFIGQVKAGAAQHDNTQYGRENQQHDVSDNGHGEELLVTLH